MRKWVEGKVVRHKEWAQGLFSLYVKAAINPFLAGQFTQIGLPLNNKMIFRPYSFSNAPFEEELEFYYVYVPEGVLTPHLVALKEGSSLWVAEKASGRFLLDEVPGAQTLWLMATGTGLGVFLSFLKISQTWERFKNIVLVHSVRTANALSHSSLIADWQKRYPTQFHWLPIVTQEKGFDAPSKRINVLLESGELEQLMDLTLTANNSQVMLCGNPEMVKEMTALLSARGLQLHHAHQPGQIHIENYWK